MDRDLPTSSEMVAQRQSEPGLTAGRDRYIDFLRAFSLVVVVLWHWGFTILEVSETAVSPNNPIGSTQGLWVITWVLQVMPVFFFVGGFTHRLAFDNYTPGTSRRFLKRRIRRLLGPSLGLIVLWLAIGFALELIMDPAWTWSAVILVLSPLWFLAVYVVLVLIAPIAIRAHWRWGELVPVWLLGLAAVLDVLRFSHGQGWAAWVNFLVIWGLAHQLGFFYDRLILAPRRTAWVFLWSGLFSLVALTNMGFYPRSLVGVPGDRFSNMGPPTLTIVGLIFLQIGVVLLVRSSVLSRLERDERWKRWSSWVTANGLPLYLFHSSGMALVVVLGFVVFGYRPPGEPNLEWWLTRPVWIVLPFFATLPLVAGYRRSLIRAPDVDGSEAVA
jgi:peptidoglycan/LPS O-acetylase OafA/YrhL